MGLDIFFLEDIRNALLAADQASAQTAVMAASLQGRPPSMRQTVEINVEELDALELRAFRSGYKAAVSTVALAFGITPAAVTGLSVTQVQGGDGSALGLVPVERAR